MQPPSTLPNTPTWLAWWNGQIVPATSVTVSMFDAGFMMGLTVVEQLRTFRGHLFRVEEHLDRLERSLAIAGIECGPSRVEWRQIMKSVVDANYPQLQNNDDLGVGLWVTPGTHPKFATLMGNSGPQICCHAHPLPFASWHEAYHAGDRLVTVSVRQISPLNWPTQLKCRSRMHYHLAEREARDRDASARALLLDLEGFVCESSIANVLAVFPGPEIVSPRIEKILPGISLAVLEQLANTLAIPFRFDDITLGEFAAADELLLCSTSPGLLPVVQLDGQPIGTGKPGGVYRRLLAAFNDLVGVDIAAQAATFATRSMA